MTDKKEIMATALLFQIIMTFGRPLDALWTPFARWLPLVPAPSGQQTYPACLLLGQGLCRARGWWEAVSVISWSNLLQITTANTLLLASRLLDKNTLNASFFYPAQFPERVWFQRRTKEECSWWKRHFCAIQWIKDEHHAHGICVHK